jgi:predicted CoA-binding protein
MAASDDAHLREILTKAHRIAIVGLSEKPERDSHEVAHYLQTQGYWVIPVNPTVTEVLGEKSYASLTAIPADIRLDIVDIFRKSEEVPAIVEEALTRKAPTIWMQLGVQHGEAARKARAAGAIVYENLCIMQQHRRLRIPAKVRGR